MQVTVKALNGAPALRLEVDAHETVASLKRLLAAQDGRYKGCKLFHNVSSITTSFPCSFWRKIGSFKAFAFGSQ